jgi:hypothetical protein
MEISLTDLKELLSGTNGSNDTTSTLFTHGKNYFIRTVTYFYAGECVSVQGGFVQLKNVSWVADTGKFSEAFEKGFSEVEMYPSGAMVNVNIGTIVDFLEIDFLPTETV